MLNDFHRSLEPFRPRRVARKGAGRSTLPPQTSPEPSQTLASPQLRSNNRRRAWIRDGRGPGTRLQPACHPSPETQPLECPPMHHKMGIPQLARQLLAAPSPSTSGTATADCRHQRRGSTSIAATALLLLPAALALALLRRRLAAAAQPVKLQLSPAGNAGAVAGRPAHRAVRAHLRRESHLAPATLPQACPPAGKGTWQAPPSALGLQLQAKAQGPHHTTACAQSCAPAAYPPVCCHVGHEGIELGGVNGVPLHRAWPPQRAPQHLAPTAQPIACRRRHSGSVAATQRGAVRVAGGRRRATGV